MRAWKKREREHNERGYRQALKTTRRHVHSDGYIPHSGSDKYNACNGLPL
jgi:hypothetical protein